VGGGGGDSAADPAFGPRPSVLPTQRGSCLKTARLDPRRGWTSSEALAARGRPGGKPAPDECRRREAGGDALSPEAAAARPGRRACSYPAANAIFPQAADGVAQA